MQQNCNQIDDVWQKYSAETFAAIITLPRTAQGHGGNVCAAEGAGFAAAFLLELCELT